MRCREIRSTRRPALLLWHLRCWYLQWARSRHVHPMRACSRILLPCRLNNHQRWTMSRGDIPWAYRRCGCLQVVCRTSCGRWVLLPRRRYPGNDHQPGGALSCWHIHQPHRHCVHHLLRLQCKPGQLLPCWIQHRRRRAVPCWFFFWRHWRGDNLQSMHGGCRQLLSCRVSVRCW